MLMKELNISAAKKKKTSYKAKKNHAKKISDNVLDIDVKYASQKSKHNTL